MRASPPPGVACTAPPRLPQTSANPPLHRAREVRRAQQLPHSPPCRPRCCRSCWRSRTTRSAMRLGGWACATDQPPLPRAPSSFPACHDADLPSKRFWHALAAQGALQGALRTGTCEGVTSLLGKAGSVKTLRRGARSVASLVRTGPGAARAGTAPAPKQSTNTGGGGQYQHTLPQSLQDNAPQHGAGTPRWRREPDLVPLRL